MKLKTILASLVAGMALASVVAPASAGGGHGYNQPRGTYVNRQVTVNNTYVNRVGYNGYRGGYYGGNGWGYAGAAIAGALIGGAIANSYAPPVYGGGYAQPYYAPAPVYTPPVYAAPPTYYAPPAQPRWHWEQQYDPSCNCVRNIQVMD